MMYRALLVLLALLALVSVCVQGETTQTQTQGEVATPFQTLEDIDAKGVETAFAEVDASASTRGDAEDALAAHAELETELDSEADMDAEADNEMDMDADADADADAEGESELDTDADSESESESEHETELDSELDSVLLEAEADRKPYRGKNQPINRHKRNGIKNIECLDGDCVRAAKSPNVKVGSNPVAAPKKMSKLDLALAATKEEIMVRAKELHKEKDWVKKVEKLIGEYQAKLNKVSLNISHLRKQTKALLRKKKQIQNIQVQNKLKEKLTVANSDLRRLQKQLSHIHGKENEFASTEKQLKQTMGALKNSLLKLRGQNAKKAAYEGIN